MEIKDGLKLKTHDDRDFKLGAVFPLPKLSELPPELIIGLPFVLDQGSTDFCTAAASCAVSELQGGVPLSFEWLFAVAKSMTGDIDGFGLELRDVCKAHVTFGCIERSQAPYSLQNKQSSFLRRINNWPPDLFKIALKHKKGSYFEVSDPTGILDSYDTLRASMYLFRNEKCGILFGVLWSWAISDIDITTVSQNGSGHALAQIGYTQEGIFVQNSAGNNAGKEGRHFFSREVINAFVKDYGAFMFHDMSVEDAKWYVQNNIKITDSWFLAFLKIIVNFFKTK